VTWTKLSDQFTDRPDLLEASRSARLLHIEALVYCNKHLRDGLLPRGAVARMTDTENPAADIAELVTAGVWEVIDSGWQIDWTDQEEAAEVRARHDYRAATQKRYRERKAAHERGDHSMCDPRFCKKCVTGNASSNKNAHETPSRPVPSRPLGRDRDKGAGHGSAGATPAHATEDEFAGVLCPHGILNGLVYRSESFICGACEELTPASPDFISEWRAAFAADRVTADEIDDAVYVTFTDEENAGAERLASAYYLREGPEGPVDKEIQLYFLLNILSAMRPGCIPTAIQCIKDEAAVEEYALSRGAHPQQQIRSAS